MKAKIRNRYNQIPDSYFLNVNFEKSQQHEKLPITLPHDAALLDAMLATQRISLSNYDSLKLDLGECRNFLGFICL